MEIDARQFQVHPSSGLPIYRQIMDQIRSFIAAGRLKPGQMLPSTREMAAALEVNMMTVSKAYSKLTADGVLERIRGRGVQVADSEPKISPAERKRQVTELLEPVVLRAIQLGLSDEQISNLVNRLLREHRS